MAVRPSIGVALSALLAGCIDYGLADPDAEEQGPVEVEETFVQASRAPIDVLFVVDNTGSMAEEQASFREQAGAFVEAIDALGLAWQLGVTTTDAADEGVLAGRPWIVTPQSVDPAGDFGAALEVGTDGAAPTAGLDAAALALADADGANRGFRRSTAALHVVFVSDGDDESGEILGDDAVTAFGLLLASEAERTGFVARVSAVVGDVPDGCDGSTGEATAAERYAALAGATGGVLVSVCDADFAYVATALGEVVVDWPVRFELQAEPVAESVVVELEGDRTTEGWSLDLGDPALIFEEAPAPDATIHVRYTLAGS